MRVASWNLYHGRAVPPAGRSLRADFAAALAGWEWDVALLQEVPPWWPSELARAAGAEWRRALTSRNVCLPAQRTLAERWPDLMKSWGGGSNAILVRGSSIVEHRRATLRRRPERRVVHAVRLGDGAWVANLHATVHSDRRAREDAARARELALAWSGDAPLVLGGDFNVRGLELDGFARAAAHDVDAIFVRGLAPAAPGEALEHGRLSDHAPIRADLRPR